MRLIYLLMCAIAFTSCKDGNLLVLNDRTSEVVGTYNGSGTETRTGTVQISYVYDATIEVDKVDNNTVDLQLIFCHESDGRLVLDLVGSVDANGKVSIDREQFVGNPVNGETIVISGGTAESTNGGNNFEVKFTEDRTLNDVNPNPDPIEEYKASHVIIFNEEGTGTPPGC